ncbi:MAG: hypothetical protein C0613_11035 [Desulfobulbaceae bacterium]|nr:MAG: hypothetical protein C0613_11035 [Desulfobulbaceae bacterium]
MSFSYIHEGTGQRARTLIFLPGWGFDGRVGRYGRWPDDVAVLAPTAFTHAGLLAELHDYLDSHGQGDIVLVGWSLGAHLAWHFARLHPHLINSLVLLAGRSSWPPADIAALKQQLAADPAAFMRDFYRKCFLGRRQLYASFVKELQDDYLERLGSAPLAAGLDYLAASAMHGQVPADLPTRVIHGGKDRIAPVAERPHLQGASHQVIEAAGHLLFAQPLSW